MVAVVVAVVVVVVVVFIVKIVAIVSLLVIIVSFRWLLLLSFADSATSKMVVDTRALSRAEVGKSFEINSKKKVNLTSARVVGEFSE